jgi:DNA replication and repair protein RecF
MYVKSLKLENFRNIKNAEINFNSGVNILFGDNAQGKTNIIEALWLFAAYKSFRIYGDKDFITIGENNSTISADYSKNERNYSGVIKLSNIKKKEIMQNDIKVKPSDVIGNFISVLFFPEHLNLIKSGPEIRRKFLDFAICQIKPRYFSILNEYNKILMQRNYALKSGKEDIIRTLDIWDIKLSKLGALITVIRKSYLEKFTEYAKDVINEISEGKEQLSIDYKGFKDIKNEPVETVEKDLLQLLKDSRNEDFKYKFSTEGAHKDDFILYINGLAAKNFCSQGQQRSCVMSLKLAEAEMLNNAYNEYPIMLFDDVFSELDKYRKSYITEKIKNKQVIITACEKLDEFKDAKLFKIVNGTITEK